MTLYEVFEIKTGYAQISNDGMLEISTCTLIKGKYNCIVNTMIPTNTEFILRGLKNHNLKEDNIDYVISTNGEYGNIGGNHLFLKSIHVVGHTIAKNDIHYPNELDFDKEYSIDGDSLKILPTPGRTLLDITVLVNTSKGTVAITGGLFVKEDDILNHYIWLLPRPECPSLQRHHRESLIKSVQRIIPGHGEGFDVTQEVKTRFLKHREDEPSLSRRDLYRIGLF